MFYSIVYFIKWWLKCKITLLTPDRIPISMGFIRMTLHEMNIFFTISMLIMILMPFVHKPIISGLKSVAVTWACNICRFTIFNKINFW